MDSPLPENLDQAFEAFFEAEGLRDAGEDVYPEIFASPVLFPLQRPAETAWMIRTARRVEPKVVMEIGADKGGGLYHWCKSLETVERVIACEIRGTPYSAAFEKAFPEIDFLWLPVSSYAAETVSRVKEWLDGDRIEVLFLDGDKSSFLRDFDAYEPMVSGFIFFHDIQDEGPKSAFQSVVDRGGKSLSYIDISDFRESAAREALGIPPASNHEGWLRFWRGRSCGVGLICK